MDELKNMIHIMNRVEPSNVGLYLLFKINSKKDLPKWEIRQMKTVDDFAEDILNINKDFLKSVIEQKSLDVIEYSPGSILIRILLKNQMLIICRNLMKYKIF